MDLTGKLTILTDSAKYDVACTSSGVDRGGKKGMLGSAFNGGICHAFAADGRCISLLKVLMTNHCIYDCAYCINRRSNDPPRAAFTPRELADLTIGFYRRNYIEGLFLSSGVIRSPDYTMELMCETLSLLRREYRFNGYIHAKAIPGASSDTIQRLGLLADRVSVNLELPSEESLRLLAPDKPKQSILRPMGQITGGITENRSDLAIYRHAPKFVPAGQSTQMIIGATPDSDFQILRLSESLYRKYELKRVFYSAYIPMNQKNALLPVGQPVPLLREHRLYQADWLLRFYGFRAEEILTEQNSFLDPFLDPKCAWALRNLDRFPVEVNTAEPEMLLRVPGIGVTGTKRIVAARRSGQLQLEHLKKLGIVMRRAVYFITIQGKMTPGTVFDSRFIYQNLVADTRKHPGQLPFSPKMEQISLFESATSSASTSTAAQLAITGRGNSHAGLPV